MAPALPLLTLPGVTEGLERVEGALRRSVETDDPTFTELASHLVGAGGKRLRPALALVTGAGLDGRAGDDVALGGAAVELVHLGSLYHDDVMDEAETRRGVESVNARWGNLRAILAGDFLLARASGIAASLGTEVASLLAATIASMCEGQVKELGTAFQTTRSEEAYLAAIDGKTASLFAASCRIGALVGGRPPAEVEALTAYGRCLGLAFQVVDDVLDVVATDEELGKPAGNDLVEGVYTLPVIVALAAPVEGPELAELLGRPIDRTDSERARKLVRASGAVEVALATATRYCDEATEALAALDGSPGTDALAATAAALPVLGAAPR